MNYAVLIKFYHAKRMLNVSYKIASHVGKIYVIIVAIIYMSESRIECCYLKDMCVIVSA